MSDPQRPRLAATDKSTAGRRGSRVQASRRYLGISRTHNSPVVRVAQSLIDAATKNPSPLLKKLRGRE